MTPGTAPGGWRPQRSATASPTGTTSPRATEPPAEPFGWITRDVLEAAAADLARQEEAFEQARVPPSARAAGKAGPR
ncbi:hypothetical protein [Streptomyces coelicolor]|uniref:hypothetical protein n=1 Tax=Streptomyces coelicolor TaxID=1902 RepID=UPI003D367E4C